MSIPDDDGDRGGAFDLGYGAALDRLMRMGPPKELGKTMKPEGALPDRVFVVWKGQYDERRIESIHSSREKATDHVRECRPHDPAAWDEDPVEAYWLDKGPKPTEPWWSVWFSKEKTTIEPDPEGHGAARSDFHEIPGRAGLYHVQAGDLLAALRVACERRQEHQASQKQGETP